MLDYSLLKFMVKQALEEMQPLTVKVESPRTSSSSLIRTVILDDATTVVDPPAGRQWEILSGMILHAGNVFATTLEFYDSEATPYWRTTIAAATDTGFYPVDFFSSKFIIQSGEQINMNIYNAGDSIWLRVLETDA